MSNTRPAPAEPDTRPFDPAAEGWSFEPEGGFIGLVGPLWQNRAGGRHCFGFAADARHANLVGVVQGGMLMTFADRALGILAWEAAGAAVVTVSFDMQFVGAGRIGAFVTCEGEVVRRTRSLVFMRGLVRERDRPVGIAQGTWKILSDRRGRSPAGQALADRSSAGAEHP